MLTEYPEGVRVTAVLALVFSKTRCLEPVAALEICGPGCGQGHLRPQHRAGAVPAAPGSGPGRKSRSGHCRHHPQGIPGCGAAARYPRGCALRPGQTQRSEPGADTAANKTPPALSAAAASSRGDTAGVPGCAGVSRVGSPDTAGQGSAESPGTGEGNPVRGGGTGEHLPAPPRSPARAGMAGAAPASSAGAVPPDTPPEPLLGAPPASPRGPSERRSPAGAGAGPPRPRSAPRPLPLSCAAASLRGHLRAGRGGRGRGGTAQ